MSVPNHSIYFDFVGQRYTELAKGQLWRFFPFFFFFFFFNHIFFYANICIRYSRFITLLSFLSEIKSVAISDEAKKNGKEKQTQRRIGDNAHLSV